VFREETDMNKDLKKQDKERYPSFGVNPRVNFLSKKEEASLFMTGLQTKVCKLGTMCPTLMVKRTLSEAPIVARKANVTIWKMYMIGLKLKFYRSFP
jgi:hypothetical protein